MSKKNTYKYPIILRIFTFFHLKRYLLVFFVYLDVLSICPPWVNLLFMDANDLINWKHEKIYKSKPLKRYTAFVTESTCSLHQIKCTVMLHQENTHNNMYHDLGILAVTNMVLWPKQGQLKWTFKHQGWYHGTYSLDGEQRERTPAEKSKVQIIAKLCCWTNFLRMDYDIIITGEFSYRTTGNAAVFEIPLSI